MRKRKRTWRTVAKVALYSATAAAGAAAGTVSIVAWSFVRPNRDQRFDCVPRNRYGKLEPVDLVAADGVRLHAWALRSRVASGNDWVLLLHGFRSDRAILHTRARFFSRRGFHVLLLHFRGHGASARAPITYGHSERKDVVAAFEYIRALQQQEPGTLGIDGVSMGAAAVAYAVGLEQIQPDWIVLESCYDNIRNALANRLAIGLSRRVAPLFKGPVERTVEYLAKLRADELNPAKEIAHARCPILVLAGDADPVLKPVEVESLHRAIAAPKRLGFFPGAGHVDLLLHNPKLYIRLVDGFLRDFGPKLNHREHRAFA